MYKSPIEITQHRINYDSSKQLDEAIFTAVVRADIHVDRNELVKALQYDRNQYEKGYTDGKKDVQPKWISVKDRLPGECQMVLAFDKNECFSVLGFYIDAMYGKSWLDEIGNTINLGWVTHWMPLPESPKEE